jgi:hypothetical protein
MTKTTEHAVDWLINTVKEALEEGRATTEELEEWLMAAILLEEMALEEQRDTAENRTFTTWMNASGTLH